MAWTAPRTWVVGEVVTASIMNTHVRDNLTALRDLTPKCKMSFINSGGAVPADNLLRLYSGTTTTWYDNDSMVSTGTITIKTAGTFYVIGETWSAVLGQQHVYIMKNTSTLTAEGDTAPANIGDQNRSGCRAEDLNAYVVNDTLKVALSHAGGVAINLCTFQLTAWRVGS